MNKKKKGKLRKAFLAGILAISTTGCQTILPKQETDLNQDTYITEDFNGEFIHHIVNNKSKNRIDDFNRFCITANDNELKLASIQTSLDILKESSEFGNDLYNFAKDNNLHFCRKLEISKGASATYTSKLNVIKFGSVKNHDLKRLGIIAHEITHAIQDKNKLLFSNTEWDVKSNIKMSLAIESAAVIGSITLAFDMKQVGDDSLWSNFHDKARSNSPAQNVITSKILNIFERSYNIQKAAGSDHKSAMEFAMGKIWPEIFQVKTWRNYYIGTEITQYEDWMKRGFLDTKQIAIGNPSSLIIKDVGKLGTYDFSEYIKQYDLKINSIAITSNEHKQKIAELENIRKKRIEKKHGKLLVIK